MRLGVDIGGSKVSTLLFDGSPKNHRKKELDRDNPEVMQTILDFVKESFTDDVESIGISTCGYVIDGTLYGAPNEPYLNFHEYAKFFEEEFDVPITIDNDANCFALAEYELGVGKESKILVGLIIGTGVGAGIIVDGKILRGVSGSGGELGHTHSIDGTDWEASIAGPAISKLFVEYGGDEEDSHPAKVWELDSEPAKKTREEITRRTAIFIANIINSLNPDCVVLGGGVSNLPDSYYESIIEKCKDFCVPMAFENCSIVRNSLGDDAGAIGAALLE